MLDQTKGPGLTTFHCKTSKFYLVVLCALCMIDFWQEFWWWKLENLDMNIKLQRTWQHKHFCQQISSLMDWDIVPLTPLLICCWTPTSIFTENQKIPNSNGKIKAQTQHQMVRIYNYLHQKVMSHMHQKIQSGNRCDSYLRSSKRAVPWISPNDLEYS